MASLQNLFKTRQLETLFIDSKVGNLIFEGSHTLLKGEGFPVAEVEEHLPERFMEELRGVMQESGDLVSAFVELNKLIEVACHLFLEFAILFGPAIDVFIDYSHPIPHPAQLGVLG